MRVLFDTNVVLDLLLDREPFSSAAADLFARVERGDLAGYLCATTITTVHYLTTKAVGLRQARKHLGNLLSLFEIASVGRAVLEGAVRSKIRDFEDAVICEAAVQVGADVLVTRNVRDFKGSPVPVYPSSELIKILRAGGSPEG